MKGTRTHINQRSLAFIVLISGVLGGLLIVFSILLLCKYCLNRKNLREAEQMKLLYETLNQATLVDGNRIYHHGLRDYSPLEPRRSNPLDRYQLSENEWQIPSSKQIMSDYHSSGGQSSHNHSYHETREHTGNKQHDSHMYRNVGMDDEQAYLQVDPRCYVRQNSNASLIAHRKSDTPRLEKGHSINVDTRPSPSSTSLSPYRQSSFDVTLAYRSPQQVSPSSPSPATSTQQDIYYTPRGSSLSVVAHPLSNTPTGSQHLSPPTPGASRKNSAAIIIEKKDLTATLDPFSHTSTVRSSVVPREHEYSRSLEQSAPPMELISITNGTTNDKQSRSFDAVHLLRPGANRSDVVNRRTKSYEYSDERRPSSSSIAPPPIVIKIPDMTELVQAARLSQLQNRTDNTEMEEYQRNTGRKATLVQQISVNDHDDDDAARAASQDLWRLRQSYEIEEQQRLDRTSPEDLSPDLLTSTSIDSAGAMSIHNKNSNNATNDATAGDENNPSRYQYRRKSSSNLLLPPPEVRRQALRRTFEKRRSCINQSNARRQQQELLSDQLDLNDENNNNPITDFSSLLNNFNSKSENSSFERSLETDFDMQSDTSSRGPNDQFTSIESSGNENNVPDVNNRFIINRRQPQQQQAQQQQQQSPQLSPHQDDSGYKSLESQNSQNRTFSLDWMSADGAESVIYVGDGRTQQRSVDVKDLDDDLAEKQANENNQNNRRSPKLLHTGLHHSYQETSTNLLSPSSSNIHMKQQRSLSTNIPLVDQSSKPTPIKLSVLPNTIKYMNNNTNNTLVTSTSFIRTASKKRREFGKDKRHASSNVEQAPHSPTDEHQTTTVHQINEINPKPSSSSTLQVRHPDLRRTKSDESRNSMLRNYNNNTSAKDSTPDPNETKSSNRLSSSTDGIIVSSPSSNPIRQHLSPNLTPTSNSRHYVLQRSPSSTTPSPQVVAFRSQRSSISFDHQTPLNNSSSSSSTTTTTGKIKSSPTSSIFPTFITKPRLKFSTVRDTAMASLGHGAPVYSMPITRDYSIDEKTNRIVNEFLMHDPTLDDRKKNDNNNNNIEDNLHRSTPKRHHHRIRPKTFDETTSINNTQKQSSRPTSNKQRYHSNVQINMRKHTQHQYPSLHLPGSIEQEEEDSSEPPSPLLIINHQPGATNRRENNIATASPSIIITGDDSGS